VTEGTFKIRKNKWHYRLYKFWWAIWDGDDPFIFFEVLLRRKNWRDYSRSDREPTSLCPYFWFVVLNTLFLPLLLSLLMIVLVVATICVSPFFLLSEIKDRRRKRRIAQGKVKPQKPKQPSMLKTFIRAKKRKVCPLIEIVD